MKNMLDLTQILFLCNHFSKKVLPLLHYYLAISIDSTSLIALDIKPALQP